MDSQQPFHPVQVSQDLPGPRNGTKKNIMFVIAKHVKLVLQDCHQKITFDLFTVFPALTTILAGSASFLCGFMSSMCQIVVSKSVL